MRRGPSKGTRQEMDSCASSIRLPTEILLSQCQMKMCARSLLNVRVDTGGQVLHRPIETAHILGNLGSNMATSRSSDSEQSADTATFSGSSYRNARLGVGK